MLSTRGLFCTLTLLAAVSALAAEDGTIDPPGVTVILNGSVILHRGPVPYPAAARQASIQGTVVVDVSLDAKGNVTDAHVLSGPAEFRRTVLESVLQWHFAEDAANSSRQVTIQFEVPPGVPPQPRGPDFNPALVVLQPAPAGPIGMRLRSIDIQGIPPDARARLLARLPVHEGDILSLEAAENVARVVREFDEHLRVGFVGASGEAGIQILLPGYNPIVPALRPATPGRIQIAASVLQSKQKSAPAPEYPPLARQARIQGVVKLMCDVGKDGSVQNVTVLSGHPLLVPPAVQAVKQWVYEPTAVNGSPAEVEAEVDVNFTLPPQ